MERICETAGLSLAEGFLARVDLRALASVPSAEKSSAGLAGFCVGGGDSFLSIIPSETAESFRARLRLAEQRNGYGALGSGRAPARRSTDDLIFQRLDSRAICTLAN